MPKRQRAAGTNGSSAKQLAANKEIRVRRDDSGRTANVWFASLRAYADADRDERGGLPDLDPSQILAWADAFRARTGEWPGNTSGPIPEAPGETWLAVEAALTFGLRGLPGRSTILRLLAEHRGHRHREDPKFTVQEILAWADAWHDRTGKWPIAGSGEIPNSGDATWYSVDHALRKGRAGLRGASSLARLLARERGVRYPQDCAL